MAGARPLALATRGWLLASAVAATVDAMSTASELLLLREIQSGEARIGPALRASLDDAAVRADVLTWVRLGLLLPTVAVYAFWIASAVRRRGEAMNVSPTRAALEYFVPIAQLVLPYRTMGRLLAAAEGGDASHDWTRFFWWSAWLVALATGQLAHRADATAADVAGFVYAGGLALTSASTFAVAGFAAQRLVARIEHAA
ncbi:MAG: DUF4328 domain-containing protein [Sandaracinus sp.]|nr:DUF4328 domain-containing protein [Sandaracinus sp.]MCB9633111.1 DUF4328 domain-containing protein [Sandaracinus sp.]